MQWVTDNVTWIFTGLIFFIIVWAIAFFARNAVAKNEKNMSPDINEKASDPISIQKAPVQKNRK